MCLIKPCIIGVDFAAYGVMYYKANLTFRPIYWHHLKGQCTVLTLGIVYSDRKQINFLQITYKVDENTLIDVQIILLLFN